MYAFFVGQILNRRRIAFFFIFEGVRRMAMESSDARATARSSTATVCTGAHCTQDSGLAWQPCSSVEPRSAQRWTRERVMACVPEAGPTTGGRAPGRQVTTTTCAAPPVLIRIGVVRVCTCPLTLPARQVGDADRFFAVSDPSIAGRRCLCCACDDGDLARAALSMCRYVDARTHQLYCYSACSAASFAPVCCL